MKKKVVLKKWVCDLLVANTAFIICILTGEFASLGLQGIFTLVGGFIIYINVKIIKKWGNLERFID